jgi:hypothetical protein
MITAEFTRWYGRKLDGNIFCFLFEPDLYAYWVSVGLQLLYYQSVLEMGRRSDGAQEAAIPTSALFRKKHPVPLLSSYRLLIRCCNHI